MERPRPRLRTRRQPALALFTSNYSLGAGPMLHDLIKESIDLEDGHTPFPDRPGLGITIRDEFVEQYAKR